MTNSAAENVLQRQRVHQKVLLRKASLTEVEAAFLHGLLIDDDNNDDKNNNDNDTQKAQTQHLERVERVLDDDMLFSVPPGLLETKHSNENETSKHHRRHSSSKLSRRLLVGLWQAHEDGVSPQVLKTFGEDNQPPKQEPEVKDEPEKDSDSDDNDSVQSDQEVPHQRGAASTLLLMDKDSTEHKQSQSQENDNDDDDDSTIPEDEAGVEHFDAWQVLKDEYAADFGLDFLPHGGVRIPDDDDDDNEAEHHTFRILGTSADDVAAHPHVLSPPLMDALLNFVPDHLQADNLWLKYSLIRDGASLDTLKRYVRASVNTILAIETTEGHVFGAFTTSPWRTHPSFYGGGDAFVWRMRHSRSTPCHSLVEQAQLESEIDVFLQLSKAQRVQCSTHNLLGIGEGDVDYVVVSYDNNNATTTTTTNVPPPVPSSHPMETIPSSGFLEDKYDQTSDDNNNNNNTSGFAIALNEDLLEGTSSRCASFKNPCLTTHTDEPSGETFQVINLEVWTFTPCFSLDAAEKLEMTQFFVQESIRSAGSTASNDSVSAFSSQDLDQESFYRRVGHNDRSEETRDRWQYRNMMDGDSSSSRRGLGASPRFFAG